MPPPPSPSPAPPAPVPGPAMSAAPEVVCAPVDGWSAVTTGGGTGGGITGSGATIGVAVERRLGGAGSPGGRRRCDWERALRSGGGGGGGGGTWKTESPLSGACRQELASPAIRSHPSSPCSASAAAAPFRRSCEVTGREPGMRGSGSRRGLRPPTRLTPATRGAWRKEVDLRQDAAKGTRMTRAAGERRWDSAIGHTA